MVKIQRYTTISNGMGGSFNQWVDHIEYDGVVGQLSGNEILEADRMNVSSTHVLIGPIADITRKDRVIFNGERYDVKYVDNPMNLNRHLEILLQYEGEYNEV